MWHRHLKCSHSNHLRQEGNRKQGEENKGTGLLAAGFRDVEVTCTHEVAPEMHAAIIQPNKPVYKRDGSFLSG